MCSVSIIHIRNKQGQLSQLTMLWMTLWRGEAKRDDSQITRWSQRPLRPWLLLC